jgi:ABC-type uncharacterized transport system permease subunit
MDALVRLSFIVAAIGYTVSSVLFFVDLASRRGAPAAVLWAPRVLAGAAVVHLTHVVAASIAADACAVSTVPGALSLAALIVVLAYQILCRRETLQTLGAFAAPLALTFLVAAEFLMVEQPLADNRALLAVHVTANLVGLGLFLLTGAVAILFVLHERRLKQKRVDWLTSKLPALDSLEQAQGWLLIVGFPLLTVGIVTGATFSASMDSAPEIVRAILAYAAWLTLAAVLVLRVVAGWRGRRASYGALVGAALVALVLVGYLVQPALGDGL